MNEAQKTGFSERLKTASDAKATLLAKFRPKPSVADPRSSERDALRQAELKQARQRHAAVKATAKQAAVEAREAIRLTGAALIEAELIARRGERKDRKALTKAEAQAKRDARYAARKAR